MAEKAVILIAEDDSGHYELVKRNLWRSCPGHEVVHFSDGQQVLDFLFGNGDKDVIEYGRSYILLLDIRMPKVDGHQVLKRIREEKSLRSMPVIMLTTTDSADEVNNCYDLGCNGYVIKPADYTKFMEVISNIGGLLSLNQLRVPGIED